MSILQNRLSRPEYGPRTFDAKDAPDPRVRSKLKDRLDVLKEKKIPCPSKPFKLMMLDLFDGYAAWHLKDEDEVRAELARYEKRLGSFPEWVIHSVIKRVIEGHGDPRFCPQPQELYWLCVAEIRPVDDEIRDIEQVLFADVIGEQPKTDEERAAFSDEVWPPGTRLGVEDQSPETIARIERKRVSFIESSNRLIRGERIAKGLPEEGRSPEMEAKLAALRAEIEAGSVPPEPDPGREEAARSRDPYHSLGQLAGDIVGAGTDHEPDPLPEGSRARSQR